MHSWWNRWGAVASTIGARLLAAGLQGVILLTLARLLGPSAFGGFATVFSIAGYLGIVLGAGLTPMALRIARQGPEARELAAHAVYFGAAISTVVVTLSLSVGALVFRPDAPLLSLAAALLAVTEGFGQLVESAAFGLQRHDRAQRSVICRRLLVLAGVVVAWFTETSPLTWVSFASVVALVTTPLWLFGLVEFRSRPSTKVLRLARGFWAPNAIKFEGLDMAVASAVLSAAPLGLYAAAARITSPLNIATSSFLSIYTPRMAAAEDVPAEEKVFIEARRALLIVGLALMIASPALAWFLQLVLGADFDGLSLLIVIVVLSVAVGAPAQAYTARLYARNLTREVLKARALSVSAGLASVAFLGAIWGATGATFSVLVFQVIHLAALACAGRGLSSAPSSDA